MSDHLVSAALQRVPDRVWDASFTEFLLEGLRVPAGGRVLALGCGARAGDLCASLQRQPGVTSVFAEVDRERAADARGAAHAGGARLTVVEAATLPFADEAFDATSCIAVLQQSRDGRRAVGELARVTRSGGRVLVIEPDNGARYWYSSTESGGRAFELGSRFYHALAEARGDTSDPAIGPRLPELFARTGLEPIAVRLFSAPVSRVGAPPASAWEARRDAVRRAMALAPDHAIARLGSDFLKLIDRYAEEAAAAGPRFVEIQHTMLFATVGRKSVER